MEIKNLSFSYGDREILKDINLKLEKGEFISIIGTSGVGKSTLLNVLSGALSQNTGSITPLNSFSYMPQDDLLMPWRTVKQNACLYADINNLNHDLEVDKLLKDFNLLDVRDEFPSKLSGGMRKRVAFLRTIMCQKDYILLDEPFSSLDAITRMKMHEFFIALQNEFNFGAVLVTHDVDEALLLSDKIYILNQNLKEIPILADKEQTKKIILESLSI